jgi:membrane protein
MTDADQHGRHATSPFMMPIGAWKDVLVRSWSEAGDDNVGLVAAGVAFYGFLALVPLLGAIVLSYGLVADPKTVIRNMQGLTSVMPADAARLIGEQLMSVVKTSGSKKGFGLLLALGLAVFGARSAAGSVVTALNIAYEEKEKRSFIVVNLLALGITAVGVAVAVLAVVAIAALGHLESLLPAAPAFVIFLGKLLSYVTFALAAAAGAATLYRYGPSREHPRWVWLTPGSLFSAVLWVALTMGFGFYVSSFGNYNATYGSLGAVVVLLTWLYLSSYVLVFGAEINAELEHQTSRDTTTGTTNSLSDRGAWVADHVADEDAAIPAPEQPLAAGPELPAESGTSQSLVVSYVLARGSLRIGQYVELKKVSMLASGCATIGLSLLRKPGRLPLGLGLVAAAVAASLIARGEEPEGLEYSHGE